jgi:hypothetical protein
MNAITPREPADLDALPDESFRLHIRAWIEACYPAEIRNPEKRLHWEDNKVWYF